MSSDSETDYLTLALSYSSNYLILSSVSPTDSMYNYSSSSSILDLWDYSFKDSIYSSNSLILSFNEWIYSWCSWASDSCSDSSWTLSSWASDSCSDTTTSGSTISGWTSGYSSYSCNSMILSFNEWISSWSFSIRAKSSWWCSTIYGDYLSSSDKLSWWSSFSSSII